MSIFEIRTRRHHVILTGPQAEQLVVAALVAMLLVPGLIAAIWL